MSGVINFIIVFFQTLFCLKFPQKSLIDSAEVSVYVSEFCLSACVCSEFQLLLFACWKRLLKMSISPQPSCCSCLEYITAASVRPAVCLRRVMEQQAVAISQQVPLSHSQWECYLSWTCVCVFMKSVWRITQICQQSSPLNLKRTALHQPPLLYLF